MYYIQYSPPTLKTCCLAAGGVFFFGTDRRSTRISKGPYDRSYGLFYRPFVFSVDHNDDGVLSLLLLLLLLILHPIFTLTHLLPFPLPHTLLFNPIVPSRLTSHTYIHTYTPHPTHTLPRLGTTLGLHERHAHRNPSSFPNIRNHIQGVERKRFDLGFQTKKAANKPRLIGIHPPDHWSRYVGLVFCVFLGALFRYLLMSSDDGLSLMCGKKKDKNKKTVLYLFIYLFINYDYYFIFLMLSFLAVDKQVAVPFTIFQAQCSAFAGWIPDILRTYSSKQGEKKRGPERELIWWSFFFFSIVTIAGWYVTSGSKGKVSINPFILSIYPLFLFLGRRD